MINFVYLVALFPLLGFITLMAIGRRLGEPAAGYLATAAVGGSFLSAVITFFGLVARDEQERQVTKTVFEWVPVGDFSVDIAFLVDPLSVAMILFVTGIGTLIHLYSIGYMHGDENFSKFFLYLNMFIFAMLMLVLGDNLLLTFLGWEGVGACSYFLISFWFHEEANATAGKKAFVTNRVGDWGFMVATFLAFAKVGSIDYLTLNGAAGSMSTGVATGLTLLLFIGAMGKSAQFPLYLWLPDAMAGPTPVSALIHAATMVTSGVYLLTRVNGVLYEAAFWSTNLIAWVGVGTALFAATIAVAQNDIKKVLAYSTVSQLGYMVLAVGTGAYVAAIFHMITHAFFKALLFLGSGSVIHGMDSAWDIGGLNGKLLWFVGLITALLTAFYMSRQVFMTFFGRYRFADPDPGEIDDAWAAYVADAEMTASSAKTTADEAAAAHDKAAVAPEQAAQASMDEANELAKAATSDYEIASSQNRSRSAGSPTEAPDAGPASAFLSQDVAAEHVVNASAAVKWLLAFVAIGAGAIGIFAAYSVYLKNKKDPADIEKKILADAWGYDTAVSAFMGGPGAKLFDAIAWFDANVIDGIVNGAATVVRDSGGVVRKLQTGYVRTYALGISAGSVALLVWFLVRTAA